MQTLSEQIVWTFVLALPVACISWTVTEEELFKPLRELCERNMACAKSVVAAKVYYPFTCTYCFSHYVAIGVLAITRFHLLYDDGRGYFVAGFDLVWIANTYTSLYARLRISVKREKTEVKNEEQE